MRMHRKPKVLEFIILLGFDGEARQSTITVIT